MRRTMVALIAVLVASGCGGEPERIYDFQGNVVSIDANGKTVTIDHENIPGLMRAMKMPFTAEDPQLLKGLRKDMPVEGKFKVVAGKYVLTDLRIKPGPLARERAIQAALAELKPEDRKLAEQQFYCPISDEPLGTKGVPVKLTIKGEPAFLCCEICRPKAEANLEATLKKAEDLTKRRADPPPKN